MVVHQILILIVLAAILAPSPVLAQTSDDCSLTHTRHAGHIYVGQAGSKCNSELVEIATYLQDLAQRTTEAPVEVISIMSLGFTEIERCLSETIPNTGEWDRAAFVDHWRNLRSYSATLVRKYCVESLVAWVEDKDSVRVFLEKDLFYDPVSRKTYGPDVRPSHIPGTAYLKQAWIRIALVSKPDIESE